MASVSFDIRELYGSVWGGLVFPELLRRAIMQYAAGNRSAQLPTANTAQLGTPIQSELALGLQGETLRLAIPPIITIQSNLNLVETVVAGLDGSVREVISANDYTVNIKGFLVETALKEVVDDVQGFRYHLNPNTFPDEALRQLRRFYESKLPVLVLESKLLGYFNINRLLLKSINFPETEGYAFVMPFEIEAASDQDHELILNETQMQ
jgi:hypothetical protein